MPCNGLLQSPDPEAPTKPHSGKGKDDSGGRVIYRVSDPRAAAIAVDVLASGWEPDYYMFIGSNCNDFAWAVVEGIEDALGVKGTDYPDGF